MENGTENKERKLEQTRQGSVLAPPVDILENDQELVLVADIPGVEPSAIKLDVQPPDFKLEAEIAGAAQRATYVRSFHVEERIDVERVNAEYKNGVLTVRLPKSSAAKPRRIEVRSA
jgi:HSP20 family molecular chaperone IbpA